MNIFTACRYHKRLVARKPFLTKLFATNVRKPTECMIVNYRNDCSISSVVGKSRRQVFSRDVARVRVQTEKENETRCFIRFNRKLSNIRIYSSINSQDLFFVCALFNSHCSRNPIHWRQNNKLYGQPYKEKQWFTVKTTGTICGVK